jgi:Tol biopolymer transport system component
MKRLILAAFLFVFIGVNSLVLGTVRIVYLQNNEIWTSDEYGQNATQITTYPELGKSYPRFSPDGRTIAFYGALNGRMELWLVNSDGSNPHKLTNYSTPNNVYGDGGPAWSFDGKWVYFGSAAPGCGDVWRTRADGSTPAYQLTNFPGWNTQSFDLSRDGTLSTFVRGVCGNGYTNKLYLDNPLFDDPILLQPLYIPHIPKFSPNGLQIAYSQGAEGATRVINIDGTGDSLIIGGYFPNAWHPSGTKLLVSNWSTLAWVSLDGSDFTFVANGLQGDAIEAAYVFDGFFSPVANLPTLNKVKAGQTIPIKWRLNDLFGAPLDDAGSFLSIASYRIDCVTLGGDASAEADESCSGSSGLQYLGEGNWQFNWKTPKSYAGQCRKLVLKLADGTSHLANFSFK